MTQASSTGGLVTYSYNGDGQKVQRVGPDGTTRYYYDGIRSIWETDGAGVMTAELDRDIFGNLLSRLDSSGTRRYYHTDGLGSTIVLTDSIGNIAASMLYDAWGNVRASSADVGKYRFTGAELDTASGLYHMGARFYDPSVGRWLSEDLVQNPYEPISLNFYAYVANNPLLLTDPTGTIPAVGGNEGGGPLTLADLNQLRQEIVDKLLELKKSTAQAISQYIQDVLNALKALQDPATAARMTGWLAAFTGTAAVAAMFTGNAPAAAVLGGASIIFTAANMYFTDVLYRSGKIQPMEYYFTQAWNGAALAFGIPGLFAGAMLGLPGLRQGALMAASVIARTLGWGGVALSYYP